MSDINRNFETIGDRYVETKNLICPGDGFAVPSQYSVSRTNPDGG